MSSFGAAVGRAGAAPGHRYARPFYLFGPAAAMIHVNGPVLMEI